MSDPIKRAIIRAGKFIPPSLRNRIIGQSYAPSRFASVIHSILNKLPGEKYPVIACGGLLEGYRMRVEWARYRCFAYGNWEPELRELVKANVRNGSIAVDVGAHIGYYSLLLSRLVGPTGQVYSFEPVPPNFSFLTENLKMNGCANVEAVNRAVLDRQTQIRVDLPEGDPLPIGVSFADASQAGSVKVETVSLDEYLLARTLKVDFLKVDAECAEDMVLTGARRLIARDRPSILMEVHHFDGDREKSPVPRHMREMGYRVNQVAECPVVSHYWAEWPRG